MRKNKKWTAGEKLEVVLSFVKEEESQNFLVKKYGCNRETFLR